MELRAHAKAVLSATTVSGKLAHPLELTDREPGEAERIAAPGRPPSLTIEHHRRVKVPPVTGMPDPAQRRRILHALANHELQAAELFAWALLAFPEMPSAFRRGLASIMADEQRHMALYIERIEALGGTFGEFPVTGHFWAKVPNIADPLGFVCTMALTFENANLDFAQGLAAAARAAKDEATALVLDQVHEEEIRHVAFGWRWLNKLKPAAMSSWEAYNANVVFPVGPSRARGADFSAKAREDAGLSPSFIAELAAVRPERPGGKPR